MMDISHMAHAAAVPPVNDTKVTCQKSGSRVVKTLGHLAMSGQSATLRSSYTCSPPGRAPDLPPPWLIPKVAPAGVREFAHCLRIQPHLTRRQVPLSSSGGI